MPTDRDARFTDPLAPGSQGEGTVGWPVYLCDDCQVKWNTPGPCWCCGAKARRVSGIVVPVVVPPVG